MNSEYMNNHLKNLGNVVGHDVSGRYSYIISQNEYADAWFQMRDQLGYPLMIDSLKRRAVIYNKKGLEQKLEKMIIESMYNSVKILKDAIVDDVVCDITNQLSHLSQSANGTVVVGNSKKSGGQSNRFAKLLAGELVKGFSDIIGDMIDPDDNYIKGRRTK